MLLEDRKIAGILTQGRPQESFAVLGIGLNVAVTPAELPEEIRQRAGSLGLGPERIEPLRKLLLQELERWLQASEQNCLDTFRARDALYDRLVSWTQGSGTAAGINDDGSLRVGLSDGSITVLDAGEVHLL